MDMNHIPDAAMTAAVLALFADGPSTIRNVASWRVKETDRLAAMASELRKLGASVEEGADYLRITPAKLRSGVAIDTYDDHRMAMSFALVALGGVPVRINDPQCVAKHSRISSASSSDRRMKPPVIAIDGPSASGKGTIAKRVARALGFHYLERGALSAGGPYCAAAELTRRPRSRRPPPAWMSTSKVMKFSLRTKTLACIFATKTWASGRPRWRACRRSGRPSSSASERSGGRGIGRRRPRYGDRGVPRCRAQDLLDSEPGSEGPTEI